MKIQSILIREGGTITDIEGIKYHFEPLADGAHVAEVEIESHIDRFLAISEGFRVYHGDESPVGKPMKIALPVVSDKQDIRSGTKETLNGSTEHEPSYEINGKTVMLDDVIQIAFEQSELSADEWNGLEDGERMARIDIALDNLAEAIEDQSGDQDGRSELVTQYIEKFGKKPHYRLSVEKIKAELEAE